MKILVIISVLLMASVASAQPFLVCDPQTDATGYIYTINGGAEVTVPYTEKTMSDGTKYAVIADLKDLPSGPFTFSVKAYNIWGQSNTVPFSDNKKLPGTASRMVIKK